MNTDHPISFDLHRGTPPRTVPASVVLLHSSTASARQWQPLAAALQPQWRVLTPEFHGHGQRAEWQDGAPMTLADDAALAAQVLEEAGGAWLVGHSYGGAVALKLASLYPDAVHGVVAYEPVLFPLLAGSPATAAEWQEATGLADDVRVHLGRGDGEAAARRFVDYWSGPGSFDRLPLGARAATVLRMPSVLRQYGAMRLEPPLLPSLARLRQPLLLLTGVRTVRPLQRTAALLRAALPQARHETLTGMGHMGPLTHPEEVNRRVLRFLSSHAAPAHRADSAAGVTGAAFPSHVATTSASPLPPAPPAVPAHP